ncbi:hypothetical protein HanPSC8_Chr09g0391181 [Helianthus annuus]|nr:hypothetical protein HanPSC8_Chr09g0391181 [Helianthus annuus]
MQQLVSTSSYTRPSYLRRLRHLLFDSHFLMFFIKDFSNLLYSSGISFVKRSTQMSHCYRGLM